jgi:aspartokinase-like uncharacterized kinase
MRRVLKIGGSLLLQPELPNAVNRWLDDQPPAQSIAIVGGGELIDAMRGLDPVYRPGASWTHWRCVDLLRTSFELLGPHLPGWKIDATDRAFQTLRQRDEPADLSRHLLAVDAFYRPGLSSPLPETWETTTDAIAGWLAILLAADELVLFKSCDVDPNRALVDLAESGVVDPALPRLADRLCPIRFVNLLSELD